MPILELLFESIPKRFLLLRLGTQRQDPFSLFQFYTQSSGLHRNMIMSSTKQFSAQALKKEYMHQNEVCLLTYHSKGVRYYHVFEKQIKTITKCNRHMFCRSSQSKSHCKLTAKGIEPQSFILKPRLPEFYLNIHSQRYQDSGSPSFL